MNRFKIGRLSFALRISIVLSGALLVSAVTLADNSPTVFLGSKTPYAVAQDPTTYQAPPRGFSPVFTQIVARHGSRGLSSPSNDLALYSMWLEAKASWSLTPAGARLGPDLLRIIRANALLGYSVPGITSPGYGNLTLRGIGEHQELAQRLAGRFSTISFARAMQSPREASLTRRNCVSHTPKSSSRSPNGSESLEPRRLFLRLTRTRTSTTRGEAHKSHPSRPTFSGTCTPTAAPSW
jgi:hypothetical protein